MRDKHYKLWSVRLSEEVLLELKKQKKEEESWNKFFKRLLKDNSYEVV